jgi:hypothetical protein
MREVEIKVATAEESVFGDDDSKRKVGELMRTRHIGGIS